MAAHGSRLTSDPSVFSAGITVKIDFLHPQATRSSLCGVKHTQSRRCIQMQSCEQRHFIQYAAMLELRPI